MTDHRDSLALDRLADLTLPAPDEARMRADIARARARFVEAGLTPQPLKATGWRAWFSPMRLGLAGSTVSACVVAGFMLLPSGQISDDLSRNAAGADTGSYPNPAMAGASPETGMVPGPALEPEAGMDFAAEMAPDVASGAGSKSAAAETRAVTLPGTADAEPAFPPLAAAPPAPEATPPATTLPRLGAKPRAPVSGDTALVDLQVEEEQDAFSGSDAFSISADQDGMWLERESGKLEVPIHDTPADMTLRMTELFMLPARGGLPQFLVLRGQQGELLSWQVFRVGETAVTYDRVITELVKDARTPGQVEGMIGRLPPPD